MDPTGQWNARKPKIFYSASIIWGLIGPQRCVLNLLDHVAVILTVTRSCSRFFAEKYRLLYLGFPIGAVLPFIPWYIYKKRPEWGRRLHLDQLSFPCGFVEWPTACCRRTHAPSSLLRSDPSCCHRATSSTNKVRHSAPTLTDSKAQALCSTIITGFLSAFASQYWARRYHQGWFDKYNYVLSSALDSGTSMNALFIYAFGLSSWAANNWWNSAEDTEHCTPGS